MNTPPSKYARMFAHPDLLLSVNMLKLTLARAGPKKPCNLVGISQRPGAPPGFQTG
jgi:hypothetical protein